MCQDVLLLILQNEPNFQHKYLLNSPFVESKWHCTNARSSPKHGLSTFFAPRSSREIGALSRGKKCLLTAAPLSSLLSMVSLVLRKQIFFDKKTNDKWSKLDFWQRLKLASVSQLCFNCCYRVDEAIKKRLRTQKVLQLFRQKKNEALLIAPTSNVRFSFVVRRYQ